MTEIATKTDLTKISTGLESFEARKADRIALAESAKDITITNIDDTQGLAIVKKKRIELKNARVQDEKEGKVLRDLITPVSKLISAKQKELTDIITPQEDRLQSLEDWVAEEQSKIQREKEEQERQRTNSRIQELSQYGVRAEYIHIAGLTDQQYIDMLTDARLDFEAEQKRIADEKAEEERKRKEEEEKLKAIRLEQEAEVKRLKAIREEQQKEADRIKEQQAKIEAERRALEEEKNRAEREKQAEIDRKKHEEELEAAKKQAAEDALKEEEARRKREIDEKEAAELLAKQEEERRIAMMPDKEKLKQFLADLPGGRLIETKTIEGDEAKEDIIEIMSDARLRINQIIESL